MTEEQEQFKLNSIHREPCSECGKGKGNWTAIEMKIINDYGGSPYSRGYRLCPQCQRYFLTNLRRCKCCNTPLRSKPRYKGSKLSQAVLRFYKNGKTGWYDALTGMFLHS